MGSFVSLGVINEILSYDNVLLFSTEPDPPIQKDYYLTQTLLIAKDAKPDPSTRLRRIGAKTTNKIRYVNDARHSHDLDTEDTTMFSTVGATNHLALQIDYGSDMVVKELYFKWGYYVTGSTGTTSLNISTTAGPETTLVSRTISNTSEVVERLYYTNLTFRYLRLRLTIPPGKGIITRLYKVVITV